MPTSPIARGGAVPFAFGALIVATLWLLARPYAGVRHDGELYAGQLLLQLYPEAMSKDIFFAYGSQDRYSVFSLLVSKLCVAFGFAATQFGLLIASLLCFIAILHRMLKPLPLAFDRWMALAAVAALSHLYGGTGIFAFAESFVTARTVAEPLALAALAALLNRRVLLAGVLLALSAATHPLIALPALVVAWVYLCLLDRRWLRALPLIAVPPLLALAGIAPFTGLLQSFDAQWWAPVALSNQHVFLFNWGIADWQIIAFDAGVLLLAMRYLRATLARLCLALLIGAVGLMVLTAVGADLYRNVLISALQTWRVLWLVHLFGLALAPFVFHRLWERGATWRMAAWALALALVATNGRLETGWVFLAWTLALFLLSQRSIALSHGLTRAAIVSMGLAVIVMSLLIAQRTAFTMKVVGFDMQDARVIVLIVVSTPALALSVAAILLISWHGLPAARAAVCALVAVGVAFGLAKWDQRREWVRHIESSMFTPHPFTAYIPPTAQVYWPGSNMLPTWMLLKRPSYASYSQAAGLLFNRNTAIEFSRRARVLALTAVHDQVCRLMSALSEDPDPATCAPKPEMVADFCRIERGPDFIVLPYRMDKGMIASWHFDSKTEARDLFLYDCGLLRVP